ncbi:hypothetical protein ASPWEDRAFT_42439 [Aspergillus wentii DTO 134E9]|uniref:DUF7514 domain-containing protein n=1 Tax=Aspergillus wentii DTO 134E9 TaxID=1073089 RepID=A0A1L9RHM2_ASPWE|nr:uncharacterized protein ASPWEDRAFT_42439 [Aspergillus wentii DTO 134E9]KAI9925766.1 hypothetical protein MW887_005572 [Aspergillus wentii]OJJ34436.1 hypothetical protein ASPWEDRAFT_42439 [Aspergillus wentii DTO 134E9]
MSNYSANYWGRLINPDKSPAPLLEQLCLEIARLMISFDGCGTIDLTPERLATFYKKVGGNYDTLFLETKPGALSFIYQSLGCFHSLQPSTNAFEPPSIPALLPSGFVRWQTIQLLMDPDEHCQYLQNAVELWNIESPIGGYFPKMIPRDAFPSEPDPEMVEWHEGVSRRLEYDYWKRNTPRSSPPNPRPFPSQFSPTDPPTEEEPPRSRPRPVPRHRHAEPTDMPRPRFQRQKSAEYPATRRPQSAFFPQPDELKTAFASPRAPSPPTSPPERRPASPGRARASSFAHTSPGGSSGHYGSDASSEESASTGHGSSPTQKRYGRRRNLTPPRKSHARRHSHEAYARKAERGMSPEPYRRHGPRDSYSSSSGGRWYESDGGRRSQPSRGYNDEVPPGPSGMRFREYVFDPTAVPPSPDTPVYPQVHARYINPVNGTYMGHARPLDPLVAEDARRASYSGMAGSSRKAGSSTERARQPSMTGGSSRGHRYVHPASVSGKRCVPVTVADMEYPSSGRRSAMYDR